MLTKTTIFLSVFLFIFGGLLCSLGFCLVVCAVVVFISVIKIVKLMFFAIKHRDSLHRRKQDGSRVNTFLLSGFMSSFCLVIFLE